MRRWFFLACLLGWLWLGQALGQVPEGWYNRMQELSESIDFFSSQSEYWLQGIHEKAYENTASWQVFLDDTDGVYSQVKQWHDVEKLVKITSSFVQPIVATTNILTGSTNMQAKTRDDMNAWLSKIDSILGELVIISGAAAKESSMTNLLNDVIDNTAGLLTEQTYIEVEEGHEMLFEGLLSQIIELISGDMGTGEDYEQDYDTPTGDDYDTPQSDETPNNDYDQEVVNDFDEGTVDSLQSSEFQQVYEGSILPFFAQRSKGDFWGTDYAMPNSLPILDTITIGDYTIDAYSLPVGDGTFAGAVFKVLHDLSATGYAIGFVWSLILLGRREYKYYMSLGRDGGGD